MFRINRIALLFGLLLLLPSYSWSAVAFDNVATGKNASSNTSIPNFTLAIGGGVTNGAVFVGISFSVKTVSAISVTVGGNAATAVMSADASEGTYRAVGFCIATGNTTGNQTISISWTTNSIAGAGAVSVSGADQTTPCTNGAGAQSGSGGSTSVTVSSTSGGLTIDTVSCEDGAIPTSPTPGTSTWTDRIQFAVGSGGQRNTGTGGNITTHWTTGSGWAAIGVNIQAASSGGSCGGRLTMLGVGGC